ncbi:MAG: hypothetical protein O3C52_05200 [Proteobacteria bacterium]|nr:hypothetical protein [Pseudomonadota bacterium]MDA0914448.1 hypothetical protein [Pseudomonadota bacterium]MDA1032750.1 hypothetical protein [Pseudomonadota bacterium]
MSSRPAWWTGKSAPLLLVWAYVTPAVPQEVAPEYKLPPSLVRQPIDIEPIERTDTVDLLVEMPDTSADQRRIEQCEEEQDASAISRTILVCREIVEDNSNYYSGSREDARDRYARETQYADPIATPDVAGEGITGHQALTGAGLTITGCIIPPCHPPLALIIDVTALPQPPAGSDAEGIALGLPAIGNDTGDRIPTELEKKPNETSPAESEEPAEGQ